MTCGDCIHSRPLTKEERDSFEYVPHGQIVCALQEVYRMESMQGCHFCKAVPGQGDLFR